MASLLPFLAGAAPPAAGAAGTAGAAAAPAAAAYGTAAAAPAVAAAPPALAPVAAPPFMGTLANATAPLAKAAAAPAFGNTAGINYGQLARLAQSRGNAQDFAPLAGSAWQNRQNQFTGMQGLPLDQKQPDSLENILSFFRNIGSM